MIDLAGLSSVHAEEDALFRHWLARLDPFNGDGARLYPSFDLAPLQRRDDSASSGLASGVRILDFTSPQALTKLADWRRTVEHP